METERTVSVDRWPSVAVSHRWRRVVLMRSRWFASDGPDTRVILMLGPLWFGISLGNDHNDRHVEVSWVGRPYTSVKVTL